MTMLSAADEARFRAKVDRRGPDECWPWLGEMKSNGYGRFTLWTGGRTHLYAHRVAYLLASGEIPAGHDVDHDCHNRDMACVPGVCAHRACCNPAHLIARTRGENLAAPQRTERTRLRTECANGHPWFDGSYYEYGGRLRCKQCQSNQGAAYHERLVLK